MVQILKEKLEALKKNIQDEGEIINNTIEKLSEILSPYQEAILMIKHFHLYKDKLTNFQVLNNIWKTLEKEKI